MKKICKIYLFRHGQTFYNREHIFTGWKDSQLTPKGKRQAQKVAIKLKNKKIDLAFQSDLSRSKQTLKEVLKYHPKTKIITDKRIRERSYGTLEGKHHSSFVKTIGENEYKTLLHWHRIDHLNKERIKLINKLGRSELNIIRRSYTKKPPRGESIKMVERRVKSFIIDMLRIIKNKKINIAISAHGNSMRPFRRYFEHLSIKKMMQLENPFDDYFEYTVKV
ncbi:MAG: histidine phosphatase family protein [Nanoarchaeota archaeon]